MPILVGMYPEILNLKQTLSLGMYEQMPSTTESVHKKRDFCQSVGFVFHFVLYQLQRMFHGICRKKKRLYDLIGVGNARILS